jgi:hypothetical protein
VWLITQIGNNTPPPFWKAYTSKLESENENPPTLYRSKDYQLHSDNCHTHIETLNNDRGFQLLHIPPVEEQRQENFLKF